MVVWKVVPRRAVLAVIFANGAPLAFAEVRAPSPPVLALPYFFETQALGGLRRIRQTSQHGLRSLKLLRTPVARADCAAPSTARRSVHRSRGCGRNGGR